MLNRWSVNALLKFIIITMATAAVFSFATGAWDAYQRVGMAGRVAVLTQASSSVFQALHNLRYDRSFTDRALKADQPSVADKQQIAQVRAAELPALQAAIQISGAVEFNQQKTLTDALQRLLTALAPLQSETVQAFEQPKAARRDSLGKMHRRYAHTENVDPGNSTQRA